MATRGAIFPVPRSGGLTVTVGLDLHKRYITACALDDAGTVLAEHRRLDPTIDALGSWLAALPLTIALEATLYRHWLERQLTALGHRGPRDHASRWCF